MFPVGSQSRSSQTSERWWWVSLHGAKIAVRDEYGVVHTVSPHALMPDAKPNVIGQNGMADAARQEPESAT